MADVLGARTTENARPPGKFATPDPEPWERAAERARELLAQDAAAAEAPPEPPEPPEIAELREQVERVEQLAAERGLVLYGHRPDPHRPDLPRSKSGWHLTPTGWQLVREVHPSTVRQDDFGRAVAVLNLRHELGLDEIEQYLLTVEPVGSVFEAMRIQEALTLLDARAPRKYRPDAYLREPKSQAEEAKTRAEVRARLAAQGVHFPPDPEDGPLEATNLNGKG